MRKTLKYLLLAVVLFLLAGQFYRPDRTNPPVNPAATFEAVEKPRPEVAAIVKRACYDCHSNETVWPWYSRIAPVSWLVADDVTEGREHLNFSEWGLLGPETTRKRMQASCKLVQAGEMPLWQYRLMHPEAKLGNEDIRVLCGTTAPAPSADADRQ